MKKACFATVALLCCLSITACGIKGTTTSKRTTTVTAAITTETTPTTTAATASLTSSVIAPSGSSDADKAKKRIVSTTSRLRTTSRTVKKPVTNAAGSSAVTAEQNGFSFTMPPSATITLPEYILQPSYTYRSANPAIAAVDKHGCITSKAAGTTTISASSARDTLTFRITVIPIDCKAIRQKGQITTQKTTMKASRFDLVIDPGIYVPEHILEDIDTVIDTIGKAMGMSIDSAYCRNSVPPYDKPEIHVERNGDDECINIGKANGVYVLLGPNDLLLRAGQGDTLVHELIHCIQNRNGEFLDTMMAEGLSTYFAEKVSHMLPFPVYKNGYEQMEQFDRFFKITPQEAEKILRSCDFDVKYGDAKYGYGFRFMHFFGEKYGMNEYIRLTRLPEVAAYNHTSKGTFPTTKMIDILKREYGSSLFEEFGKWFQKNQTKFHLTDAQGFELPINTNHADVFPIYNYAGIYDTLYFSYTRPTLIDFSTGFDYATQFRKNQLKHVLSIRMYTYGNARILFCDANGHILKSMPMPQNLTTVTVPGAETICIYGDGTPVYLEPQFHDMISGYTGHDPQ